MSHFNSHEEDDKKPDQHKRPKTAGVSAFDLQADSPSPPSSSAMPVRHVPLSGLALPRQSGESALTPAPAAVAAEAAPAVPSAAPVVPSAAPAAEAAPVAQAAPAVPPAAEATPAAPPAPAVKAPGQYRPEWEPAKQALAPDTTDEFGKFELTAEQLSLHAEVIAAIAKYLEADDKRPVLLYFGVGVGNPSGVFGETNNTANPRGDITAAAQESPSFLQDARSRKEPYRTLSVLYQTTGASKVQLVETGDGQACIKINLRFPLRWHKIIGEYSAVAKKAARVVVLNAVTDKPYEALLKLAVQQGQAGAYVSSYMQTGKTTAYNWIMPKLTTPPMVNTKGYAGSMADVFHQDK